METCPYCIRKLTSIFAFMSFYPAHLTTAITILEAYDGEVPFSIFIKNYFAQHKKHGSRDRRTISSLCYNYFRLGDALTDAGVEERVLTGLFVCSWQPNELLQKYRPEWNEQITLPLQEKLKLVGVEVAIIFPFVDKLSEPIDVAAFSKSFLVQPDVFIRVRPGKYAQVKEKLTAAGLHFNEVSESCFAFASGAKLDEGLQLNREAVIQDLNSQRVGEMLADAQLPSHATVWDCCAASGGKSIMVHDMLPHIQLTVSDVRQSIIHNLRKRFKEAGITKYSSFVADITNAASVDVALKKKRFDLVVCDAPCSGSGTWSRTPEQLMFFREEEITRYSKLQKAIAVNASRYVKQGGYFLYITCSVFKKENEEVVEFIEQQAQLKLVKMRLLKGYSMNADTMFCALFRM